MSESEAATGSNPDRGDPGGAPATPAPDCAGLLSLLADWLPAQRWFAGKGAALGELTLTGRSVLPGMPAGTAVEHLLVTVNPTEQARGPQTYQLFVGWRGDLPERIGHDAIGAVGSLTAYDALHDTEFSALLLRQLARGGAFGALSAHIEPDSDVDTGAAGLVLGAEQSNTSIVYGDSAILKVFRRLEPGPNPDAELHRALHRVGCTHIADPLGELTGVVRGEQTTLALLTRYFANSADGWAMAGASVRDLMAEGDLHADEVGGDFAAESERLGEAIAAIHRDLADALGTGSVDAAGTAEFLSRMAADATTLAARVPSLEPHLARILARYAEAAAAAPTLEVQRIHGDLHLGQVLRTLTGWAVIDFEGEPATPLAVRRRPASPLQDVAGMLRSFDYAAHQMTAAGVSDSQHAYRAAEWASRNQDAFCHGYARVTGADPRESGPMLRAFELAKAVYEVGYEHGHRPSWEPIPLAAVAQLSQGGA